MHQENYIEGALVKKSEWLNTPMGAVALNQFIQQSFH